MSHMPSHSETDATEASLSSETGRLTSSTSTAIEEIQTEGVSKRTPYPTISAASSLHDRSSERRISENLNTGLIRRPAFHRKPTGKEIYDSVSTPFGKKTL